MLTAAQTKLPLKMSEQLLHLDDSADKRAGISNSISNKQQPQNTPPPIRPRAIHQPLPKQPWVISSWLARLGDGGTAKQIVPRLTCFEAIKPIDRLFSHL